MGICVQQWIMRFWRSILHLSSLSVLLLIACHRYINLQLAPAGIQHPPRHIALLLPLQGYWGTFAQAIRIGFESANAASTQAIKISVIDTSPPNTIQAAYRKSIQQGAALIVGPLLKSEVQQLANEPSLQIPVLTLNYLEGQRRPIAHFYQFGLSPLDEAKQAAFHAWQRQHRSAVIIAPNTPWGTAVAQAFHNQWEHLGGHVMDRLQYAESASLSQLSDQLRAFLKFTPPHNRREDFEIIFLAATPTLARQLNPLLGFYFAAKVPIYATALVYDSTVPTRLNRDLDTIIFCDTPWHLGLYSYETHLRNQLAARESQQAFKQYASYYALGVDAFHIAMRLSHFDQDEALVLSGATGLLSLNKARQITRTLPCAQFKRGIAIVESTAQKAQ